MKTVLASITLALVLGGCAGAITGHEYTKQDFVIMYKVVKSGVTTFMTPEQIKKAQLDKLDITVTDTYKLVSKNDVGTK